MSGLGFGGSKSKSKGKDIAPGEFVELREPYAQQLASFFGFGPVGQNGALGATGAPSAFDFLFQESPSLQRDLAPEALAEPITPEEQSIIDEVLAGAFGDPERRAAADVRTRTIEGEFLTPESNPFLRAAIEAAQRPVREAFEEERRADLGAFTRAGQQVQESSPFFRARGLAERGLADALGDVSTRISAANFEAERGRQAQAAREAEEIDATRVQNAVQRLQAVALPRLIRDLGVQRGIEAFNERVNALLALLSTTGATTAAVPTQKSKSSGFQFQT